MLLVVRVSDVDGNAIAGATVRSSSTPAAGPGATLSASSVVTDSNGDAVVTATANTIAGPFFVAATLDALQATFSLTNLPGTASLITATGGTPQSAIVGQLFAAPVAVHVTDAFGNAAVGTSVTFWACAGERCERRAVGNDRDGFDTSGNAAVTATANATSWAASTVTAGIVVAVRRRRSR